MGRYKPQTKLYAEDNPRHKLTMPAVIEARRAYFAHEKTARQLADENGVFITTMQRALYGVTWKHDACPPPKSKGAWPPRRR